ncbi:hypothetical protein GMDG_02831 [Pseudogymnoascus destructans 20631-21]|uniref:Mediator of RNA polymerase II transcription subunit 31 n=1 Tax=Pseudogymnoascus destructans (strain ATCC MYA-4855 / 20631-21) TaxID=658429 RepID=L8G495_PSED2|nr:hypothetical protein GMDG_02831 [Pseudogymnoascus destructans 20631-21]
MADSSYPPPPPSNNESKYGGFTRFEIELEFVQCLANPHYLLHLATLTTSETPNTPSIPLLAHLPFIAYLAYLQYFSTAPYLKYLTYPGPTLKNLELLQNERFRRDVLSPDVVGQLVVEGVGAVAGSRGGDEGR